MRWTWMWTRVATPPTKKKLFFNFYKLKCFKIVIDILRECYWNHKWWIVKCLVFIRSTHNRIHSLRFNSFWIILSGTISLSYISHTNLETLLRLMCNNFAKDHNMIKCIVYDSIRYIQIKIHSFLVFISYGKCHARFCWTPYFCPYYL